MIYVIPYNSSIEPEISQNIDVIGRLRAFPASRCDFKMYSKDKYPYRFKVADHVKKIILDSGAFAMSQIKRKIDKEYMTALEQYYFYNSDERCICVAPDVFLNPMQSMYNFSIWNSFSSQKVAAVLQSDRKGYINLGSLMKQAEYYRKYTDNIFFSNPGLTSEMAKTLKIQKLFKFMKNELKVSWIHVLGAGWNINDIKGWKRIGYFDSMDSIAYYSTTNEGEFGSLDPLENINTIMEVMKSGII